MGDANDQAADATRDWRAEVPQELRARGQPEAQELLALHRKTVDEHFYLLPAGQPVGHELHCILDAVARRQRTEQTATHRRIAPVYPRCLHVAITVEAEEVQCPLATDAEAEVGVKLHAGLLLHATATIGCQARVSVKQNLWWDRLFVLGRALHLERDAPHKLALGAHEAECTEAVGNRKSFDQHLAIVELHSQPCFRRALPPCNTELNGVATVAMTFDAPVATGIHLEARHDDAAAPAQLVGRAAGADNNLRLPDNLDGVLVSRGIVKLEHLLSPSRCRSPWTEKRQSGASDRRTYVILADAD
mmetsp:Transcript_113583/g.328002  ORF Transcript_113583/g.328002 Transcript_113583/m.328002 type:complete len:304 (+) Transcript_113583:535-1446(+)